MSSQCNLFDVEFEDLGRRKVVARFDGGRMSSDSGVLLLREVDRFTGLTERLASCFTDYRDSDRVEHDLGSLLAQRIYGLALGYEDLNDHDQLRDDSILALALGKEDVTGADRVRARDRGHPLAGATTLNRLELGNAKEAETHRYKKIVPDFAAMNDLLVDMFVDVSAPCPEELILDLDATDDPLHGNQEDRYYNAYYHCYCYLPLYVTCGDYVLRAVLRPSNVDAAEGAVEAVSQIVERLRLHWPETSIIVRGDSGFCREDLMVWCEENGVDYILGLGKNKRLVARIDRQLRKSWRRCIATKEPSRRYRDFRYQTRDSWCRPRRVVGKAEWLPGRNGDNPRFVVTSLPKQRFRARELYEELYCGRGEMENRIKEQQLDLFADRTSSHVMSANQFRLYMSVFADMLMKVTRQFGAEGTSLARAQPATLRKRLLKIAGRIKVTTRRVWVSLSSVHPCRETFAQVAANLRNMSDLPGLQRARASPG